MSSSNHTYYTAVIAPPLAALAGSGLELFRSECEAGGRRRVALPTAIALTALRALVLDWPTRFLSWLLPLAAMLAICGAVGLWIRRPRTSPRRVHSALAAGIAAMMVVPAGWAFACLDPLYAGASTSPTAGPVGLAYDAALQNHRAVARVGLDQQGARDTALFHYLTGRRHGEKYLVATQAAYAAVPLLRVKSAPMLVMGGFTPYPTARRLGTLVTTHQLHYALLTTKRPTTTTATTWVKPHCTRVRISAYGRRTGDTLSLYDCNPKR